jgi:nucleotide-binding universal stress UspA family protein
MTDGYYRIVVPTDFSSCAEEAWAAAQRLSKAFGSELVLVHVLVEPTVFSGAPFARGLGEDMFAEARRWAAGKIEAWAQRARDAGLPTRIELRAGNAAQEIVALATDERADLIVIGTHGRGGLDRALLGSVADRVIRQAPCHVLSVRA